MADSPPRLILASTSPHRRALLARLGLPFEVAPPGVDEEAFKARGLPPRELVTELSCAKAEALAPLYRDAVLIGSDQAVVLDGEVLGKPGTRQAAIAQLQRMQGRTHELLTGVAVHDPRSARTLIDLDVHRMRMRPLSPAAIERYVDRDRPLDCAGAYRIEGLGIALFEAIAGEDDTAVIGLPLIRLVTLLGQVGVDVLAP